MKKTSKILLILLISVFLYWFFAKATNVYAYAISGAIFELLWLPAIAMTFSVPVVCAYFWIKEKCRFSSVYLSLMLLSLIVILWVVYSY